MTHEEDISVGIFVYFKATPGSKKYDSPENRALIAERIRSFRVQVSETAVVRAVSELIQEGMERVDGGNEESDAINAARIREAKEKARLERIAAPPLSAEEVAYFQRLSQPELYQLYFSDDVAFKIRFDIACDKFGFNRPLAMRHPTPVVQRKISAIPTEAVGEEPVELSAQQYHSIPTRTIQRKYASSPAFRMAVDTLIREGKI